MIIRNVSFPFDKYFATSLENVTVNASAAVESVMNWLVMSR